MGKVEAGVRRRARKQNIQRAVLSTIAAAGILAMGVAAPNTLQLLRYTPLGRGKGKDRVNAAIARLIERGEVEKKVRSGKPSLIITSKGRVRLARLALVQERKHPRRWDRRWRIVIFDIPEKFRRSRDVLRGTLISIGFHKLQGSVWVYPHDCEEIIMLLKTSMFAGRNILYIVSDAVENDRVLRKAFGLPPA